MGRRILTGRRCKNPLEPAGVRGDLMATCPRPSWPLMHPPIQTLRAPNPGYFTGAGTNTYIFGTDRPVVVDPGPDLPDHLDAILAALGRRQPEAIVVTHAHLDHSALARNLAALTGAPVLAFGDAASGISASMRHLANEGLAGGEGCDADFVPDLCITHDQRLALGGVEIDVIHTPGHMGGHICLALGDTLLSGDHVMGWSTSIVSPPEGDMAAYMGSLHKLAVRRWLRFLPGHGDPIEDPAARLATLIDHRKGRESAVLATLAAGPATAKALAARIYTGLAPALLPAATRNVLAHLIDLQARNLVARHFGDPPGPLSLARFARL